jgi:hypothetical protein
MFFAGTSDARGFNQWKQAGRYVTKGSKAFTILAPRFIRERTEGEEEAKTVLIGFLGVPVFRVEDTEGKPLDDQKIELPELPLMVVAREWGISIKAIQELPVFWLLFSREKESPLPKEECVLSRVGHAHQNHWWT